MSVVLVTSPAGVELDGAMQRLADGLAAARPEAARVYDALTTGGDGQLWVRRTPMPGDTVRQWDVFDEAGRYVARLNPRLSASPRDRFGLRAGSTA